MRDYIFRLQLDISRFWFWSFFLIVFLSLWQSNESHGIINIAIFIFGIALWMGVLIETINLMLPESNEPYDWQ